MPDPLLIGGRPVVTLEAQSTGGRPTVTRAEILPGRGMMLLQARARTSRLGERDVLAAPPLAEAARLMDGGPDDFIGNQSFAFGAAILLPYANRIRGRAVEGAREIAADVAGRSVRLPRNWGGKAAGAEQYAMHGLMLDRPPDELAQASPDRVRAHYRASDFGGRWPSRAEVEIEWALADGGLALIIEVANAGSEPLPMGVGWHPYFALPSKDRRQARVSLAARARLAVNNYDEVLPTGEVIAIAGTSHDLSRPGGLALGDLYLDDCFVGLASTRGRMHAEILDPAAGYGVAVSAEAPPVKAVQIYAPPDKSFVVLEPQFNWPDPYGGVWPPGEDTGMALLPPGEQVRYAAWLSILEA